MWIYPKPRNVPMMPRQKRAIIPKAKPQFHVFMKRLCATPEQKSLLKLVRGHLLPLALQMKTVTSRNCMNLQTCVILTPQKFAKEINLAYREVLNREKRLLKQEMKCSKHWFSVRAMPAIEDCPQLCAFAVIKEKDMTMTSLLKMLKIPSIRYFGSWMEGLMLIERSKSSTKHAMNVMSSAFFLSKTRGDFRNICEKHRAICVDNKVFHVPLTMSKSSLPVFESLRKGQSIA